MLTALKPSGLILFPLMKKDAKNLENLETRYAQTARFSA